MAKKNKTGPPYDTSKLDAKYIVVSNPYGITLGRDPKQTEVDRAAAWIRRMFGNPQLSVEEVLFMRTVRICRFG
jgi:hypothetical protein